MNTTFKSTPKSVAVQPRLALGDVLLTVLAVVISGLCVHAISYSWALHSELLFGLTFVWLAAALIRRPAFLTVFGWVEWGMAGFVTFTACIGYLVGAPTAGNRALSLGLMFAFHFIYKYFQSFGLERCSITIVKFSCLAAVPTYWTTLVELLENPWSSRQIKTGGDLTQTLREAGVGGYEFVYGATMAAPILIYSCLYGYRLGLSRYSRALAGIGAVAIVILAYLAQYLTAIVLLATAVALLCILAPKRTSSRICVFALTGLMLCSLESWAPSISAIAREVGGGNQIVDRVDSAIETIGAGRSLAILDDRSTTWGVSWRSVSTNWFFGELLGTMPSSEGWSMDRVGEHSQLLDVAALYGVLLGALQVVVLVGPFVSRKRGEGGLVSLNVSIGVVFIVLMAVNNQTPSAGLAVFLVFPVFYDWAAARTKRGSSGEPVFPRGDRWLPQVR